MNDKRSLRHINEEERQALLASAQEQKQAQIERNKAFWESLTPEQQEQLNRIIEKRKQQKG